jgi:hypothetical protein
MGSPILAAFITRAKMNKEVFPPALQSFAEKFLKNLEKSWNPCKIQKALRTETSGIYGVFRIFLSSMAFKRSGVQIPYPPLDLNLSSIAN